MYQQVMDFVIDAGRRLKEKAGQVTDIGITKQFLTEEDLRIERGLKEIISKLGPDHSVYAEEENDDFQATPNVWVIDPISSTKNFIEGKLHYTIVVTHLLKGGAQFAAVYDPSVDELFTAMKGQGAFLNGNKLEIKDIDTNKIIFRISSQWRDTDLIKSIEPYFSEYEITSSTDSVAIHYCDLARGRVKGVICFAKDSFPNFAGSFVAQEAGGVATNLEGESNLKPTDRIFIAAPKGEYEKLFSIVRNKF